MLSVAHAAVRAVRRDVRRRKRHPQILPRQILPRLLEVEYAKALIRVVINPVRKAYAPLVKEVRERTAEAKKTADRMDALSPKTRARAILAEAGRKIAGAIKNAPLADLAKKFAKRTQTHQRVQLNKQVRHVLGVDPTIMDKGLAQRVGMFVKDNVALVKRVPKELHDDLSDIVEDGIMGGWTTADLADRIEERFDISERHARLIASDQITSFYADVNHARQQEMGVDKFIWRTVHDERVRGDPDGKYPNALPSHFDLDGQMFSYDDPPQPEGADEPILPGGPVSCRCYADPVLSDLNEEEESEGEEEDPEEEDPEEEEDYRGDRFDFDPNQPRNPAGGNGGGRWAKEGEGGGVSGSQQKLPGIGTPTLSPAKGPKGSQQSLGLSRHAYVRTAMENLQKSSRTAQGQLDLTANPDKVGKLAQGLTAESAQTHATENYRVVTERLYDQRDRLIHGPGDLRSFVDGIAADVNRGIVRPGELIRTLDVTKYGYTAVKDLPAARDKFFVEFDKRLRDPKADPIATAAWAERQINFVDHFYSDGVGKTSSAVSNWVLMRGGVPLPIVPADRKSVIAAGTKNPEHWEDFYRKMIPVDTQAIHRRNGEYDPERMPLHDAYARSTMDGRPKSTVPTFYMTGGGPASGKTSALLKNPALKIPDATHAAVVNPDDAKKFLPEYRAMVASGNPLAAGFAHEESSDMVKDTMHTAIQQGHDVVYDSTGDSGIDKLSAKVEKMRAAGAQRVVAAYATVDPKTAILRSDGRAETPGPDFGRVVNHRYIEQTHADVSRTFQAALKRGTFDEATLWDTNGKDAKLVVSYTREGGLTVKDPAAWSAFQAIGAAP